MGEHENDPLVIHEEAELDPDVRVPTEIEERLLDEPLDDDEELEG